MRSNIINGAMLVGALALASCSTTSQLTTSNKANDDVYFSAAIAGDAPEYRRPINEDRYVATSEEDEEDYYYYDSYASRINRFSYASPFNYYDDYYYGYNNPYTFGGGSYAFSPYGYGGYGGYGYGGLGYGGGWGLGLGVGLGYGGFGYGFSPYGYGFNSPYNYGGFGYGFSPYGYGGGWGIYSAYNNLGGYGYGNYGTANRPRPNRGGAPTAYGNGAGRVGYNGNYPNTGYYPGRTTNSVRNSDGTISRSAGRVARPARTDRGYNPQPQSRPTYQPASVERSSNSGMGSSGGGGGSRGGGGGGRPSRP